MPSLPFPNVGEFRDAASGIPDIAGAGEPGFASTYDYSSLKNLLWNYGALAPIGAGAAGLWYLNQKEKARAAKKKPAVHPQVMLKAAAPDLKQILENIRWHLPKMRVPDTVAGAVLGGGAGAVYDAIKGRDETGKRRTGRRMLTGALAGAGLTNLIGDRARRYISNTKLPMGYTPNAAKELTPSLGRVWRAGVLDKQDYDPKAVADVRSWRNSWGTINDPIEKILPPRYELVRRQFGLPVPNADNAWFKKTPEGYYSLNEDSPDYHRRLRDMFGSFKHRGIARNKSLLGGPDRLLSEPEKALQAFNHYGDQQTTGYDFFGAQQLFGGMQVPHIKDNTGVISGIALDRWDQTHTPVENKYFKDNLWKMLTDSKWRKAPLNQEISRYLRPGINHTNMSAMKALGGRVVWDDILSDELPWVGQKFKIAPRTTAAPIMDTLSGKAAPNTFQYLRADNSPATPAMGWSEFNQWNQ